MVVMILTLLILAVIYYKRYTPVVGVQSADVNSLDKESVKVVDVRDYNESYKDPVVEAVNMPIAYMKRNYHEIAGKNIHVVAADELEKNMSIRFFRKRGIHVTSYTLMN